MRDQGSVKVAPSGSVWLPQDPPAPKDGVLEVGGDPMRPTAFLKTHPSSTRVLVRGEGDDVLKAVLRLTCSPPHVQAIPRLLEALALWYQTPLHVVLSAHEAEAWCPLGLVGELGEPLDTLHYAVELRAPDRDRRRGRRIEGMGSFIDVRQLVLGGVR